MSNKLSAKEKAFFWEEVRQVCSSSRMNKSRTFYQHGKINIYVHSLRVAYICYYWVKKYHLHVDEKALIRGALLHDYFLYDWPIKNMSISGHMVFFIHQLHFAMQSRILY